MADFPYQRRVSAMQPVFLQPALARDPQRIPRTERECEDLAAGDARHEREPRSTGCEARESRLAGSPERAVGSFVKLHDFLRALVAVRRRDRLDREVAYIHPE